MVNPIVPLALLGFISVGLAFSPSSRKELLARDHWTCQGEDCLGYYLNLGALQYRDGWMVNAAHFPDEHRKEVDHNIEHGRCLCVHCHIIEEIERGNHSGAAMLYEKQTIRHRGWLAENGYRDEKMPMRWYYDWEEADERGKLGLAQAYAERFAFEIPMPNDLAD